MTKSELTPEERAWRRAELKEATAHPGGQLGMISDAIREVAAKKLEVKSSKMFSLVSSRYNDDNGDRDYTVEFVSASRENIETKIEELKARNAVIIAAHTALINVANGFTDKRHIAHPKTEDLPRWNPEKHPDFAVLSAERRMTRKQNEANRIANRVNQNEWVKLVKRWVNDGKQGECPQRPAELPIINLKGSPFAKTEEFKALEAEIQARNKVLWDAYGAEMQKCNDRLADLQREVIRAHPEWADTIVDSKLPMTYSSIATRLADIEYEIDEIPVI